MNQEERLRMELAEAAWIRPSGSDDTSGQSDASWLGLPTDEPESGDSDSTRGGEANAPVTQMGDWFDLGGEREW